jgi:rhamnose transport system ATP-binding protein
VTQVELERIRKSYGGTTVLHDVSLRLRGGQVHGLVGENGAGKSTLLRVLCGATVPDAGRVLLDDRPVRIRRPRDALAHGIALVSQEVSLVPARSVLENVFLGRWANRGGWCTSDRRRFDDLARRTGFGPDPRALVGELPIADRQRVEIMRALATGARVIALDEPTALFTRAEADRLMRLVRGLAADGVAVVLISHLLEEVLSACDVVTVLRDGRHVLTAPAGEQTPRSLVDHMVGRPVDLLHPEPVPVGGDAPVVLAARDLRRGSAVRGVDVEVRAGEIVGLAGLVGSGRTETLRLIFGADHPDSGEVTVHGRAVRPGSPARAMARGIAMVPESRERQGLVRVRPVRENIALATLGDRQVAGFVRRRAEARRTGEVAERLNIRGDGPVLRLSGGNQQRTLFGKWLVREPAVLLVDEPTRGVDVAAKAGIHRLLVELAARGIAVLLVSSQVEEVLGLSHRVLVMRDGKVAGEFARGAASREDVLALAFAG